MENKQYYKPEPEELHVNYECEACFTSYGGVFTWDENGVTTHHEPKDKEAAKNWCKFRLIAEEGLFTPNNTRNMNTALMLLKDNRLRTQYLDKEAIEAEGWEYYTNCYVGDEYRIGEYTLTQVDCSHDIIIQLTEGSEWCVYDGECKSANELRKIMQWTGIKKSTDGREK